MRTNDTHTSRQVCRLHGGCSECRDRAIHTAPATRAPALAVRPETRTPRRCRFDVASRMERRLAEASSSESMVVGQGSAVQSEI